MTNKYDDGATHRDARMGIEKATQVRAFRFTPTEWTAIERECQRLNMSPTFYVRSAVLSSIGRFKPLVPNDFWNEGEVKGNPNPDIFVKQREMA